MGGKADKNIIVVDAAEKWPAAKDVREAVTIPTVRGAAKFDLRAVSAVEWEAIRTANASPDPPTRKVGRLTEPDYEDSEYKKAVAESALRMTVAVIDAAWQSLPGETLDAKVAWAETKLLRGGDLDHVFSAVNDLSGFQRGWRDETETEVAIACPEDWEKASQAPTGYLYTRAGKTLRFTLRGIPGAQVKAIEAATATPPPPIETLNLPNIPGRRGIVSQANPDNPAYKAQVARLREMEAMLILEASLGFAFPGKDSNAKLDWLRQRPWGEVLGLQTFVRLDVLSYRARVGFGLSD